MFPRAASARLALACLLFFLSGLTALVYQVVWQRLLILFSGADVHATTIIVGAFMAGLGCGSLAGGYVSDRLSRRGNLLAFAAAELAIGLFGYVSVPLYYDLLHIRLGHVVHDVLMPALLFLSLLWPTFFMGASLPLLARALTLRLERAASTLGVLYGVNALGASAGALLATWWMLPRVGLQGSLMISAAINALVGVVAALLATRTAVEENASRRVSSVDQDGERSSETLPFAAWIWLNGLSGFLALSLEILWFRAIGVIAKSTAVTFGSLLAVYLFGLGLGASAGSLIAPRVRRPALVFFFLQTAIGLYAGLSTIALMMHLDEPALAWLRDHLGAYNPPDLGATGTIARLYLAVPIVLMGPPTLLMGLSFPMLQKVAQTNMNRLGARVGVLMLANVAGSTAGAIVTGQWALRHLGTAGTLKTVVATSAVFAAAGVLMSLRSTSRRWMGAAACAAAILAVAGVVRNLPSARTLWAGLHASPPERIVYREDETGLSLVKMTGTVMQSRSQVYVNGIGQSWIPYGDIHTILGALPAFVHPDPRDVAVIGLGSGDTAFALAGRESIERILCVEIVRSQIATLAEFDRVYGYQGLAMLFRDPRVEHVTGDGRRFVMRSERGFDIIEADALRPGSAYSGNLYSDRYFMMLRERLKPRGLAVTWAPTPRVRRTFLKVFPHVVAYRDILLGSRDPIAIDVEAVRERLAERSVREFYKTAFVDVDALLAPYLAEKPEIFDATHDRSGIVDINTDLFPRDEFEVATRPARPPAMF